MWGELCFRVFANADVVMSIVYFCICVRVCVCESWLCPEFPENPDSTHLIATHYIVTPSPRYSTRSAHPALPFPFTLPSSLLLRTFLCCSIRTFFCRRLHFIGTTLLRGCFSKGHKLVIIQSWKSLLDQWILFPQSLSFILDDFRFRWFFFFLEQSKRVKLFPGHKSKIIG